MTAQLLQGFYLGEFFVEPLSGQVTGPQGSAHLPPTASEVLLCLARRPSVVVDKEELLAEVWGSGRGSPEALSHAISDIRHALGDRADNPAFIQTLPRRGYRLIVTPDTTKQSNEPTDVSDVGDTDFVGMFDHLKRRGVLETAVAYLVTGWLIIQIADVVFSQLLLPRWAGTFVTVLVIAGFPIALILSWFLEFRDGRAVLDSVPRAASRRRRLSRAYIAIVSAMAIASIGVYGFDRIVGLPVDTDMMDAGGAVNPIIPVTENSIAVLPFYNIDGSETAQIFADGFAEDVTNRLARIPGLAVSARGDAWSLSPNSVSADVRRRLRVEFYLEGSVRITDDVLRVVVQLIDSETGFHIVSRGFDREIEDFNQVQREITDLTIANLRVALPVETQAVLDASYDDTDVDAYVLYRRGRAVFERPRSIESLDEAIGFYRQALELDPRYAAAYAGLCKAFVSRFEFGGAMEDIRAGEIACATALEQNPRLYMVYSALGTLYRRTGRYEEAESAFDEALRINAQDVPGMLGLAGIYRRQQRFEEAEDLYHTAIELQPGNWRSIDSLGTFLFYLGRYEEASAEYRKVVFLDPKNGHALGNLGSALMMAGDFEAAQVALEESLEIREDGRFRSNLGIIYYYLGRFDESVEVHRAAVDQSPSTTLLWLNLADALHFAGRGQEADDAFRRATALAEEGLAVNPSSVELLTSLAWARQMLGDDEDAAALIDRGLLIAPEDPYSHYYQALIHTRNGVYEEAVSSLERAVELGYPVVMLRSEPYLEPLRSEQAFKRLVSSVR